MYLENLYLSLGNKLLEQPSIDLLTANGLPEVAHVDLFENQYLNEEREEVYPLPAIFIEFASTQSSQKSKGIQQNTETIRFHVEWKKKRSTAMNKTNQTKALLPLRLVDAINIILSKFQGLRLVGRELDTEPEGYPVHILEYEGVFENLDTERYKEGYQEVKDTETKIEKTGLKHRL